MMWQSASEFWAMGGYGVYVWGSLGVSAALLALEVWWARMGRRQALDAVCEAMDSEGLDAEPQGVVQDFSVGASIPVHMRQGAAS